MIPHTAELPAELPCHGCGYDLRAHADADACPECGASVAEARKVAAIPRRPSWRNSDPRWRRRILAGTWILVLLPLMDFLRTFRWASAIHIPSIFGRHAIDTLEDTLLCDFLDVYALLIFCIGAVLLFSRERGRHRARLDWTRRWGVICSYVTFILGVAPLLFLGSLIGTGIGALFLSMPLKNQPHFTMVLIKISWALLRYGPHPKDFSVVVLFAFSAATILLACFPLYDALRSSGPKVIAILLLAPLALIALMHLAEAVAYCVNFSGVNLLELSRRELYFRPDLFAGEIALRVRDPSATGMWPTAFIIELIKWTILLTIASWLTVARLAAWKRLSPREPDPDGPVNPTA